MNIGVSHTKWGSVRRAIRARPHWASTSKLSAGEMEEGMDPSADILSALRKSHAAADFQRFKDVAKSENKTLGSSARQERRALFDDVCHFIVQLFKNK
jgi:hypothetical protein